MESSNLLKNLSFYTLSQLITQSLSIILLPIYISNLSPSEYGVVATIMTIATFFNAIMQYGLGPTIIRFYYDFNNKNDFKIFFTSILLFSFVSNFVLISIVLIFYKSLFLFIIPELDINRYILYTIFYSFFYSLPILSLSLFRVESSPYKFLFFSVLQFFLSIGFIYYFLVTLDGGALGKIKGEFYSRIPLFFLSFYFFSKYLTFKINYTFILQSLKYGIPLMFQSILWWGLYRLDYFLISHNLGSEMVGLYNIGFQLSYILITIGISFSLAWTPYYFSIAKDEKTPVFYGNILMIFLLVIFLISLVTFLFVPDVLLLIGAKEYMSVSKFLIYLLIGAIFQSGYFVIQQLLMYSKKTNYIPIILLLGLSITFVFEYLVIQTYGIKGLSIIKMIGFCLIFFLTYYYGNKYYPIQLNYRKVTILMTIFCINLFFILFLDLNRCHILIRLSIVLLNIITVFLFRFFDSNEFIKIKNLFNIKKN